MEAKITIVVKNVPFSSKESAIKWLEEYFYALAGSNDGSEFLANLPISNTNVVLCDPDETN